MWAGRNGCGSFEGPGDAQQAAYAVGDIVHRRNEGEEWGTGFVVSIEPLLVTTKMDKSDEGYEWDKVRPISKVNACESIVVGVGI